MNPELNRLMYRLSDDEGYVVHRLGDYGLFCVGNGDDILIVARREDTHVYDAYTMLHRKMLAVKVECAVAVAEVEHWLDYERDQA